ncbi:FKBP-type peptidyl-prolyl cis-trans isomerase [Marinobacterium arenosum]|uniref:FKBP-type peptidyl-prolyl cis-trans isomerase n=1 Tax=Marinobacterium arenosum TaxID=2862496 RepID=UPI001C943E41|nr:peptidylprolyl isomerase [Marinobacterium arenosum]MBY4676643.1 peptidylprolyl isomerase [Marinobacterium arenosum]
MTVIADDKVIQFHYSLNDADGNPIETSRDGEPMAYLHGHNNMIPALEAAMTGKAVGDSFSITLAPADSYGEREEGRQQRVPIKHLQGLPKGARQWQPGMVAMVQTDQGARQVTVIKASKFMVTIDTNHPLAGKTLTYDVEIVAVRDASDEEIAHGHAHGIGGHQH